MKGLILALLVCFCVTGVIVLADQNLVALHLSTSPQYDSDCLATGCHDTLLQDERSLDSRIVGIHQRMIPYVPGYNPRKGASSSTCRHCHRSVDLINKSAGTLRKNVSAQVCVVCHTSSGPGIPLYK
jgi:hypothetical protein